MRVVGKFTPSTTFEAISQFNLIVYHSCNFANVTPSYIPSQVNFDMEYPIPEPLVIKFMEWEESIGICLPFIYKLTLGLDGYLPNFIIFN